MASDPRTKRSAHAVVVVALEVDVGSSWGGECSMDQVYKQAVEEAEGRVRNMIEEDNKRRGRRDVRIHSTPKATAVVAEREVP